MAEAEDLMESVKKKVRAVLMSVKEGVSAGRFLADYEDVTMETIPYKKLGFASVNDLIKAMPDAACVRTVQGQVIYFAVADETTQHLQNLIQKQKTNKKRNPVVNKQARFPKRHPHAKRASNWDRDSGFNTSLNTPPPARQVKGFHRQRPILGTPPPKPFSSQDVSPLMVTVHSRQANGGDRRFIERREAGSGARSTASRSAKENFGQRAQDKKPRGFELPPRFLKMQTQQSGGTDFTDKPVAVVYPNHQDKTDLSAAESDEVKAWAAEELTKYHNGLWYLPFLNKYKQKFNKEAPSNFMDVLRSWPDVVFIEKHDADRYILHAAKKEEIQPVASPPAPAPPAEQKWENFIVLEDNFFEVGETIEVYASYCISLNHFYLQHADSVIDDVTEKLAQLAENGVVPKISDLQPGVFCAALYSDDQNWYRARVLVVHSDTEIEVMFVDYGNAEKVSLSDMRCLTEETARLPAQAVYCALFALKPFDGENGFSEKAKQSFVELMGGEKLKAYTSSVEEGCCMVELWTEDNEVSLNEKLYNDGVVDTYLASSRDPPDLELPQDGYVEVVVAFVDLTQCRLRLVGPEYSGKLDTFEDKLSSLYERGQLQAKRLQENSICIAHTDCLYHRVKIRELRDNKANCLFVDHGYTEWFPLDNLVPLDKDVNQSLPYQAVLCTLLGLEEYMSNPTTITELVDKAKDKICVAEIIEREPLKVMLYDTHSNDDVNINEEIARKLVTEGHNLDLSVFTSDTASEDGQTSVSSQSIGSGSDDVRQLQSATERLTVTDTAAVTTSVAPQSKGLETAPSKQTALVNGDGAKFPSSAASAPSSTAASATSVGNVASVSPYSDSLCVAYDTWPLPAYATQPEIGEFADVYVQSVSDPSNFVAVPIAVAGKLEKMMEKMNAHFKDQGGAAPTVVPEPKGNHLYMMKNEEEDVFYRTIYLKTSYSMLHVFLPDFCHHTLIQPDQLFFLPKTFWSLPFCAFKACLYGIKPPGGKTGTSWPEAAKYKFTSLALNKTLVALPKGVVRGEEGAGDQQAVVSEVKLSLHLIDTSQADVDVVIADELLAAGLAVSDNES